MDINIIFCTILFHPHRLEILLSSLTVDQENHEDEEATSKISDAKLTTGNPEEDTVAETNTVDNPKGSNMTTDASQSIEAGELPFIYPPPPPPEASDVESRFLSAADLTTNSSAAITHAESALANSPAERRGSGFLLLAAEACKCLLFEQL